ncbi:hypothetical protein, partial [Salmonella sp. SAL4360]|uniref:hypothetical protein n=1 Tax=Salmonella sp. SAL4360 TaxID=3159881 RepID=UPI0039791C46
LTLAGALALRGDAPEVAEPLGRLGFRKVGSIPGTAPSGLYVLFGIDSDSPAKAAALLGGMRVRLWRMGEPVPTPPVKVAQVADLKGLG